LQDEDEILRITFVNDNVHYGGEVTSVDFISTELAEQIRNKSRYISSLLYENL